MHITLQQATNFLSGRFNAVAQVKHLADGWWAQAFSFTCDEGKLVLRISAHVKDFLKDKYAFDNFNRPGIPIPVIKEMGQYTEGYYYCVSFFCEGITADTLIEELDIETGLSIVPAMLIPLQHIHSLDASQQEGWGITNEKGTGGWKSWPAYLLAVYNHKNPVHWQELKNITWLDGILFEKLWNRMQELFIYLPEEKKILHGDYGFDNLILNREHQVVAVLDWGEMLLGDALYDLVHMNEPWKAGNGEIQYLPFWKQQVELQEGPLLHFEQRLECYQIYYTLLHLHLLTSRKEEEGYMMIEQWARKTLL
jgi:hygromycin-B 4-O-kinase